MLSIENGRIRLEFNEKPFSLKRIINVAANRDYFLESNELEIDCSNRLYKFDAVSGNQNTAEDMLKGSLGNDDSINLESINAENERLVVVGSNESIQITIEYILIEDLAFAEKRISILNKSDVVLNIKKIKQSLRFKNFWLERQRMYSFGQEHQREQAAIGYFFKNNETGLFWGMNNPFFAMYYDARRDIIELDCATKLFPGEMFEPEETVFGVHQLTGTTYQPHSNRADVEWRPYSYEVNPGRTILDIGEIESLQSYVRYKMPPQRHEFNYRLNLWTMGLSDNINDEDVRDDYIAAIDAIADTPVKNCDVIGGFFQITYGLEAEQQKDLSQFRGLHAVLNYINEKDLGLGVFVCTSFADYRRPIKPHCIKNENWQVLHCDDTRGPHACFINNEFRKWMSEVIISWVKQYNANGVTFDFFDFPECFDKSHAHLPGEGTRYLQWRGAMEVVRSIREEFPDIYLSTQCGFLTTAPWSCKYSTDTHMYYDWSNAVCCPFPTTSLDQILADNVRLNAWWKNKFSFVPLYRALCPAGHYHVPAFDFRGWRYSVLSSVALGAESTALTNYPLLEKKFRKRDMDFLETWKTWANKNREYRFNAKLILGEPGIGKIDGVSQIINDEGFIFLFNPNPRSLTCTFMLNEEIGFMGDVHASVVLNQLDIETGKRSHIESPLLYKNSEFSVTVKPHAVMILEMISTQHQEYQPPDKLINKEFQQELTCWETTGGEKVELPNISKLTKQTLICSVDIPARVKEELENQYIMEYPPYLKEMYACVDPARLILELAFIKPGSIECPKLKINGNDVRVHTFSSNNEPEKQQFYDCVFCYWADVTSIVEYGKSNYLQLELDNLESEQFQGALLVSAGLNG